MNHLSCTNTSYTRQKIPVVKERHSISFVHITMINFPTDTKKVF